MKWSKYGIFFKSERNGWLLYNAASNAFLQVASDAASSIDAVMAAPDTFDFTDAADLYFNLRVNGFLVDENHDEAVYNITKMRRLSANYASPMMMLTIAPTRACNFGCPYCYEKDRERLFMSEETEDKLVAFIERYKSVRTLQVAWYGGEPLLAFDIIKRLNGKLRGIGKELTSMIITNGYLLNDEVIRELDTLKTKRIQITLDGDKETHDGRRYLLGGGGTFDVIIANLDKLVASGWQGGVQIRVNVEASNEDKYASVYHFIKDRYGEKYGPSVFVYPGFVHDMNNPDSGCYFESDEKARFIIEQAGKHGVTDLSVFPSRFATGCTAETRNGYVVGPEGELYKCWNDLGRKDRIVGTLDSITDWNMGLVAEYMVAASHLDSEECKRCLLFPVCNGGCALVRRRNYLTGENRDHCSHFKSHLKELLELHYEQKMAGGATDEAS